MGGHRRGCVRLGRAVGERHRSRACAGHAAESFVRPSPRVADEQPRIAPRAVRLLRLASPHFSDRLRRRGRCDPLASTRPAPPGWAGGSELGPAIRPGVAPRSASVEAASSASHDVRFGTDGAGVERQTAASGRGAACPGRVRSAAIRKVRRPRGWCAPGMGWPSDRVVDKDGSTPGHRSPTPRGRPRVRLRSVRAEWRTD